jgi:putative spermidine/putrescine transport system ATP-binding protein
MRCALPEQPECFVKVPLDTHVLENFEPGAPVQLAFAPEYLRVFS